MRLIYFFVLGLAACSAPSSSMPVCADIVRGCELAVDGSSATIKTDSPPRPLHPFTLEIHLPQVHQVTVELTMRDMDMGSNLYRLQRDAQGVWRGRLTLPVCVSGRRDWILTLIADDKRAQIAFQSGAN